MSNAFKSFVGGLAGGYITESNRQEDNERRDRLEMRQAKLDERQGQEFDLRKRSLESQLSDQDLVRSEKTALKDSQADVTQSNEWSQSTAGKTPEEIQAMAERMSTGEDVGQAGVSVGSGAQQKSFLKDEAGLAKAKAYAEQQNNPDAKAGRWIDTLKRQGRVDEAKAFEGKWEAQKVELQNAQLDAVANAGLGFIYQENYPAFVKAYNDHYKDGRTAVYEPGTNGAGRIVVYDGDPKDGRQGGVMSFANKDQAASQFLSAIKPAEAMKQHAALEREKAKELNDWNKFTRQTNYRAQVADRNRGGVGGSGGQPSGALQPNVGTAQNPEKVYERWIKHFSEQSQSAAKDGLVDDVLSPTQIFKSAQEAARNEIGFNQATQKEAIQKRVISERLRAHLNKKDFASYKNDYDQLINMGSDGFTVDQLAGMGFMEESKYRKDSAVDQRLIGRK